MGEGEGIKKLEVASLSWLAGFPAQQTVEQMSGDDQGRGTYENPDHIPGNPFQHLLAINIAAVTKNSHVFAQLSRNARLTRFSISGTLK